MSGAELIAVIGVISSVLAIVDASKEIYSAAKEQSELPQVFKDVGSKLPLITKLLKKAEGYSDQLDPESNEKINKLMSPSKEHAENIRVLFKKVAPVEGASRRQRYKMAIKSDMKGDDQTLE